MTTSIILLSGTGGYVDMAGPQIPANGYYGFNDGLHTISIFVQNFIGRVYIEASLENNPAETDWFPIIINPTGDPFLQFPINPANPTGDPTYGGDTAVLGFSFTYNILWLRARMDRSHYLISEPWTDTQFLADHLSDYGVVKKILLAR